MDEYLRSAGRAGADRLLDQDPGGPHPLSVAASWAVAFDRLAADDPAALELLTLVAWLGPGAGAAHPAHRPPRRAPDPLAGRPSRDPLVLAALHCDPAPARHGHGDPATASSCTGSPPRCCAPAARTDAPAGAGGPATVVAAAREAVPGESCGTTRRRGRSGGSCSRMCWPSTGPDDALDAVASRGGLAARPRRDLPAHAGASARPRWRCCERAYDVRRDKLGDDHPDTLTSASNLAMTCGRWVSTSRPARSTRTP